MPAFHCVSLTPHLPARESETRRRRPVGQARRDPLADNLVYFPTSPLEVLNDGCTLGTGAESHANRSSDSPLENESPERLLRVSVSAFQRASALTTNPITRNSQSRPATSATRSRSASVPFQPYLDADSHHHSPLLSIPAGSAPNWPGAPPALCASPDRSLLSVPSRRPRTNVPVISPGGSLTRRHVPAEGDGIGFSARVRPRQPPIARERSGRSRQATDAVAARGQSNEPKTVERDSSPVSADSDCDRLPTRRQPPSPSRGSSGVHADSFIAGGHTRPDGPPGAGSTSRRRPPPEIHSNGAIITQTSG